MAEQPTTLKLRSIALEKRFELIHREAGVGDYFMQQAAFDVFACVNWHDRPTAGIIAMPQYVMASLDPRNFKACLPQRADNVVPPERWQPATHAATVIRSSWGLMSAGIGSPRASRSSITSSIASRALAMASSNVSP